MTHAAFAEAFKAKGIQVRANRSLAFHVMNGSLMPMRYRAGHIFWSWVWLLMFPGALVLGVWFSWWAAILCFVATSPLRNGIAHSACEHVLEHALEDANFYELVTKAGMFHIEILSPESIGAAA